MMACVIEGWLSEPSMIRAEFTLPIMIRASIRGTDYDARSGIFGLLEDRGPDNFYDVGRGTLLGLI